MSVINDTLKALELRGGRGAMPQSVAVPGGEPQRAARRWRLPLVIGLLIGAIGWAWWPTLSRLLVASDDSAAEVEAVADSVIAEPVDTPAEFAEKARKAESAAAPEAEPQVALAEPEAKPVVADPSAAPVKLAALPERQAEPEPAQPPLNRSEPAKPAEATAEPPAAEPASQPELAINASALSPAEQAQQLWQQAQQSANPEALLVQALALDPTLHDARLAWLALLAQRGEADAPLMEAARAFPQQAAYPLLAAEWSLASGDTELAGQWLDWAARLTPDPKWLGRRAALAQQLGRLALAQQDYLALLKAEPTRGAWWFGLGYVRDSGRDLSGATDAYRRALETADLSQAARAYVRDRLTVLENR
ncbi:hypothetical protein KUV89_11630 [Marinobacter hydrocarbonoclasticus]|nr:hypothetical protein [Marinobacter nauticus]